MNKSIAFKKAHKITKATIKAGECYAVNFGQILKMVLRESKFSLNMWKGKNGERRVYVKIIDNNADYGYVGMNDTVNKVPDYSTLNHMIAEEFKVLVSDRLFLDVVDNYFKGFEYNVARMCGTL